MFFRLILAALLGLLASCATCEVSVTRFHKLPPKGSGESFKIMPPEGGSSLESQSYLSLIRAGFEQYGWVYKDAKDTDYRVAIAYGISDGKVVNGSLPIMGQTGGGTTYHSGTVSGYGSSASFSGTSYAPATFGVVGAIPTSHMLYSRHLLISAVDRNGSVVFEGKSLSNGTSGTLSEVMPAIIEAAFTGFPGQSGKTKTISKPLK